jgi:hypothetical protein
MKLDTGNYCFEYLALNRTKRRVSSRFSYKTCPKTIVSRRRMVYSSDKWRQVRAHDCWGSFALLFPQHASQHHNSR